MINYLYIIVSILSIFFYVTSVQFKKKKHILLVQTLASTCYLIVYIIKGAWSGVSIETLEGLKNIIFVKVEKNNKKIPKYILFIFLFLLCLVSVIFFDGVLSLLPLVINILLFISTYKKNPKYIRYIMLLCGILWGCYNLYIGAYIILIGNILEVLSAFISIFRFKKVDSTK